LTRPVRVLACAVGGKFFPCSVPDGDARPKYFEVARIMSAYGLESEAILDATAFLAVINQVRR
jgi:hypothetical protein